MKVSWTQGLTDDLAKEIRGDYLSSRIIRHRLKLLIEEKVNTARKASRNKEGYEISNWALKQADHIGYERALFEIIELIKD